MMVSEKTKNFLERMMGIDRRIIFIFIFVALSIPMFISIDMEIPTSPEVEMLFETMERLPDGAKVMVSLDYDPSSEPELQPMAETFFIYAQRRKFKVICIGLWPQGAIQAERARAVVEEVTGKEFEYGEDYINLGFQSGNELVIQRMGSSIPAMFPRDYFGRPIAEFPIMQGVTNFSNIDYVFNLSAGYPGTVEWVLFAADRFDATVGAGNTAVQAPMVYPYLGKQLKGLAGGMKGGAEFEILTDLPGRAVKYMVGQTFAHTVIVLFIIVANIAFFATRGDSKGGIR
ncbi:MAG: hypothetical protein GY839_04760 [candidate division Zixibacteria bacterium]|nr:hypothetical protein [candidate division Zixibacteria bacterium]